MSERPARYHGLESFLASAATWSSGNDDDGISIQILPQPGFINLRGNAGDQEFVTAVTKVLGQDLPVDANTLTVRHHRVYWLGPNEWLLLTPYENTAKLHTQLSDTLLMRPAAVTDVSGGNVVFRLAGNRLRDVMAKGCTLNLHPDYFQVGRCAQSGLAKANVLIGIVDDQPVYEVIVRRSFAEYLALWLQSAAAEYGVTYAASANIALA